MPKRPAKLICVPILEGRAHDAKFISIDRSPDWVTRTGLISTLPGLSRADLLPVAHLASLGGGDIDKTLTGEDMMNVLQGQFYSTAFRVIDDDLFAADARVIDLQRFLDIHSGGEGDDRVYCITSRGGTPRTRLRVTKRAVSELLSDADQSKMALEDDSGWIATLQKHLHPDLGIVVVNDGAEEYKTYIVSDCAGWTR